MGVVSLAIVEPQNGQRFLGAEASNVSLRGRVDSSGHGALYYKWYSNLADVLNGSSDNPLDFAKPLAVGSHVLTFTAKDVPGDGLSDLQAVRHAGMSGGPPEPDVEAPCVVHVFAAGIIAPAEGAALSRSNSTLAAVAPSQWGTKNAATGLYERNPEYHKVNEIRYRWRFQPSGPPDDRAGGELALGEEQLAFGPGAGASDPMVLSYQGPLPTALDTGNYTLTLRVEDMGDPTTGNETSLVVVLT